MGLIGETQRLRVDVPHEAGEWFEIQPLSWASLEVARRLRTEDAIKQASLLDAEMLKGIQATTATATATANPKASSDALDVGTVLERGISSWSYAVPVTPESVRSLDEPTAQWAFEEIASRSLVSAEEQGNGAAQPSEPS